MHIKLLLNVEENEEEIYSYWDLLTHNNNKTKRHVNCIEYCNCYDPFSLYEFFLRRTKKIDRNYTLAISRIWLNADGIAQFPA